MGGIDYLSLPWNKQIDLAVKTFIKKCTLDEGDWKKKYFAVRTFMIKNDFNLPSLLEYLDTIPEQELMNTWQLKEKAIEYQNQKFLEKQNEQIGTINKYKEYSLDMLE